MPVTTATVTIPAGGSVSNSLDCTMMTPLRMRMPAKIWAGESVVTFLLSTDNVTFRDLMHPDGQQVSAVVIPDTVVLIEADIGVKAGSYLKIRAGRRGDPVVLESDCSFEFVMQ